MTTRIEQILIKQQGLKSVNESAFKEPDEKEVKAHYLKLSSISADNYKDKRINLGPEPDTISKFSRNGSHTTKIKNWIKEVHQTPEYKKILDRAK